MSSQLCLKWNNHSSSFVQSLSVIQTKERYCDATIICQGKFFSVHRVVLSTCSEYFEEMFECIQCQHPYIVFKDIEPNEMELLLNYMYQGEVNVIQEYLPALIKAAEALKIKGLAVPDDIPATKESFSRKRGNSNNNSDTPSSKRRSDESKRRTVCPSISQNESDTEQQSNSDTQQDPLFINLKPKVIKEEPQDFADFVNEAVSESSKNTVSNDNQSTFSKEENIFVETSTSDLKVENNLSLSQDDNLSLNDTGGFEEQSLNWSEFTNCNDDDISSDIPNQDANHESILESLPLVLSDFSSIVTQHLFSTNNTTTTTTSSTTTAATTSRVMDRSHQCPFCLFKSQYKHVIVRHIKFKHTGERPHGCPMCNSRFVSASDLQRHLYTHTGESAYPCRYCCRKFKNKSSLTAHMSICSLKTQQRS